MLHINELVIDDEDVMALDTPEKVSYLFQTIAQVQLELIFEFPEEEHMVFVRVPYLAEQQDV